MGSIFSNTNSPIKCDSAQGFYERPSDSDDSNHAQLILDAQIFAETNPGTFDHLHKLVREIAPQSFEGGKAVLHIPVSDSAQLALNWSYAESHKNKFHPVLNFASQKSVRAYERKTNGSIEFDFHKNGGLSLQHYFDRNLCLRTQFGVSEGKMESADAGLTYFGRKYSISGSVASHALNMGPTVLVGHFLYRLNNNIDIGLELASDTNLLNVFNILMKNNFKSNDFNSKNNNINQNIDNCFKDANLHHKNDNLSNSHNDDKNNNLYINSNNLSFKNNKYKDFINNFNNNLYTYINNIKIQPSFAIKYSHGDRIYSNNSEPHLSLDTERKGTFLGIFAPNHFQVFYKKHVAPGLQFLSSFMLNPEGAPGQSAVSSFGYMYNLPKHDLSIRSSFDTSSTLQTSVEKFFKSGEDGMGLNFSIAHNFVENRTFTGLGISIGK